MKSEIMRVRTRPEALLGAFTLCLLATTGAGFVFGSAGAIVAAVIGGLVMNQIDPRRPTSKR